MISHAPITNAGDGRSRSGGTQFAENERAVVGEVGAQVKAIEQRGPNQRAVAHRQNGCLDLSTVPDDRRLVDRDSGATVIGQVRVEMADVTQIQSGDGWRRQGQRAREAGFNDALYSQVRLTRQTHEHVDPRLQPDDRSRNQPAVRVSELPNA
jgi:hypothetical protein